MRAVAEQANIMLERKALDSDGIKELGSHMVAAKPHPEVEFSITVEVIAAD